jgi:hypothetical protein
MELMVLSSNCPAVMTDKAQQLQIQTLLNKLNECRKVFLS